MSDVEHGSFDHLTLDDLLEIAAGLIGRVEVRDPGLLASTAARPQASAFGTDAYPTLAAKAAALLHGIARNHALVDGNKRLAWAATRAFCLLNGRDIVLDVDAAERLVLAAAVGEEEVPALAGTIEAALR